jgi:thiamine pyrophosphate-dependent acetolactate synthase large subunit-like protein
MTTSTIESAKKKKNEPKFCSRCAITLHGHAGQFCEQCQSILEIESALKQKKELETKQQQQQQPTTRLKEEEKSKPVLLQPMIQTTDDAAAVVVNTTTTTTTTSPTITPITSPTKIGDFYYQRSLWQEIVVPIQNIEKNSAYQTYYQVGRLMQ